MFQKSFSFFYPFLNPLQISFKFRSSLPLRLYFWLRLNHRLFQQQRAFWKYTIVCIHLLLGLLYPVILFKKNCANLRSMCLKCFGWMNISGHFNSRKHCCESIEHEILSVANPISTVVTGVVRAWFFLLTRKLSHS